MPLRLKLSDCTGCQLCQLACSAVHEGVFNPEKARLKIIHEYTDEGIHIASKHCFFCKKCEEACPVGAISNNGRWMIVDHGICIGCGDCGRACPKDVIYYNADRKSIICDLCEGAPKCMEWCPKAVISLYEKAVKA
jgi:carbon-monoxide dehydrogenase iron sulfur subunit